jgi:16S rRNA (cytosine1402-N4)-methyltransferase
MHVTAPPAAAGGAVILFGEAATSVYHEPVLAEAVRAWARGARRAVDATVGGGGHAELLREAGAEVLAIDRDADALASARTRLGEVGVRYLEAPFGSAQALAAIAEFRPDRTLLDLGVSSAQLDRADRGFTFRPGAPLDMRMTAGAGPTAADLLNTWTLERLAASFADYGDEPRARALARCILRRRLRASFHVSDDFVNAIREVHGPRAGPAVFARLFQALRIAVNDELGELERALPALRDALVPGGQLGVITYHSGEDRIVKHAFREWGRACVCPPAQPVCTCRGRPLGASPAPRGIRPDAAEIAANPRARSARLRTFEVADGG